MKREREMIVAVLGNFVSPGRDYLYDPETDEAYYWDGEYRVCTPFDEFVELAFESWSSGVECRR